jgi:gliding motility-associated-like protein
MDSICAEGTITFQGIETVPDTSVLRWSWDFANGQTADVQNPPAQLYNIAGNYQVRLVATNSTGCTDTTLQDITIHPIPVVTASIDSTICLGQTIQLTASGTDTYTWLPPNPGLSCTDCATPLATPTVTTTYRVRGASVFGCANTDSLTITVIQPTTVLAPPDDSLCIGQGVNLRASGTDVYSWSPATGLNNPSISNPVARPTVTTTYTVTGSDFRGCFVTTDTVRIDVFPFPTLDLGPDITMRAGTTNQVLNATVSNDVVSYLWSPATGLSCTTCPAPVATPRVTTTYNLRVTNNGGCITNDAVTIFVVCLNSNLFMPNTFSPNADGMNDIYYPRGRGIERVRSLKIFNRWGQLVFIRENFNANDPGAGWDGRYRGILSPPDVYVYTIEVFCENESIITLKGDVMLVR